MSNNDPLLKIGTYGTHVIKNPAGTFSFVGTVAQNLPRVHATYDLALSPFVAWFNSMDTTEQREHVGNLRNDIFAMVMNAKL